MINVYIFSDGKNSKTFTGFILTSIFPAHGYRRANLDTEEDTEVTLANT